LPAGSAGMMMASYRWIRMLYGGGSQVPGRFRQRAVVLLVEDNPDDVVMIREAFEQSLTPVQLYVVSNGAQAIKFVRRTDAEAPPQPHTARSQPTDP
jgi:hypothetical protein